MPKPGLLHIMANYSPRPPTNAAYPCLVLVRDNWDDFTYKTVYHVHLFMTPSDHLHLGSTKIAQADDKEFSTAIPSTLDSLPTDTCSIGQSFDYYREFDRVPDNVKLQFLRKLNDIVYFPDKASAFQNLDIFTRSLLRTSTANALWTNGVAGLDSPRSKPFSFSFSTQFEYCHSPHAMDFTFLDSNELPSRFNVIVGNNGTGKTQYMRRLADAIAGCEDAVGTFDPQRPPFSKAVMISYSIFDAFVPARRRAIGNSYSYHGIWRDHSTPRTRAELIQGLSSSLSRIDKLGRSVLWTNALESIFPHSLRDVIPTPKPAIPVDQLEVLNRATSSGQLVCLCMLADICANSEPHCVIFLDEPEMHLHPNAIAGLMQSLHTIIDSIDCFAVIATHSPLILQQVPSRYIKKLSRIDGAPLVSPLDIETFGENLTTISDSVFKAFETPSLFMSWAERALVHPSSSIRLGPTARAQIQAIQEE